MVPYCRWDEAAAPPQPQNEARIQYLLQGLGFLGLGFKVKGEGVEGLRAESSGLELLYLLVQYPRGLKVTLWEYR